MTSCLLSGFKNSSTNSLVNAFAANLALPMQESDACHSREIRHCFGHFGEYFLPSLSDLNITDPPTQLPTTNSRLIGFETISLTEQNCMEKNNTSLFNDDFSKEKSNFLHSNDRAVDQIPLSKCHNEIANDPLHSLFGCQSEPLTSLPSMACNPMYSDVRCSNIEDNNFLLSISDLDLTDKSESQGHGVFPTSICSPEIYQLDKADSDKLPPSLSDLNLTDIPTCLIPISPQNEYSNLADGTSVANAVDSSFSPFSENEPTEHKQKIIRYMDDAPDVPIPSGRKHQWYTCGKDICCHLRNESSGSPLWFLECTRPTIGGCHGSCKLRPKYVQLSENIGKSCNS